MFHEHIRCPIEEDQEGFDEFGRGYGSLPPANHICGGLHVPRPTDVGKAAHPTTKGKHPIPEKDPPLHEVSKTVKHVVSTLGFVSGGFSHV